MFRRGNGSLSAITDRQYAVIVAVNNAVLTIFLYDRSEPLLLIVTGILHFCNIIVYFTIN